MERDRTDEVLLNEVKAAQKRLQDATNVLDRAIRNRRTPLSTDDQRRSNSGGLTAEPTYL